MVTELYVYLMGFRYSQMSIAAVSILLLWSPESSSFWNCAPEPKDETEGQAGRFQAGGGRSVAAGGQFLVSSLPCYPSFLCILARFGLQESPYLDNKWGLPLQPVLSNFVTALAGERFFLRFASSLILTVGSVGISLIIACLAAYAFARMPFRGKKTLFNLVLALMVVPPVVMVVPLFVSMVAWKMVNTYQGVILIYVGLLMPFSVFLMTNFFRTIPREIIEAARMDGCSTLRVFWSIMMPLSAPAVLTLIVVNAMWVWNELLIALIFLQRDDLKTLMVGIASMRSRNYLDIPATMAGLLVATIPIVILYIFGQRYFIRGLTSGAVK
jgi:ABC-type glycerol-3-phosphate transport system permease component